ncbi:MAG: AMP-binding protein [Spirochaetales bacterium]|nr:AMP-binding protein [Spirochaetales bacterium]
MIFHEKLTIGNAWKLSSEKYSELPFTASINSNGYSYAEAAVAISRISAFLSNQQLKKGEKIALISENRAEWGLCWLGITTMGCVAVPVMTDFSSEQMLNILEHSEARFVYVSEKMFGKISESNIVESGNYCLIDADPAFSASDDKEFSEIQYIDINDPDDTAALIYTSGTTGISKGVLLSHKNIMTNAWDSTFVGDFQPGDAMLSVLPLAHMYEFTQGFMTPMIEGANITYLGQKPSPTLMMKALKNVRPHFMLSVPLLIEKIYKTSVLGPVSKSKALGIIYRIPPLRKLLNKFVIGKKLLKTFGGRLKFFGIGGAPLSETVERFLREAAFPYAVGYGLTETAPCLAGSAPFETIFKGIGPEFKHVKLRVSDEGEIQASGDTIMSGYYKDEEKTAEVFTEDGWFKTGDLGSIDTKGNLYIKGRLKNLILGPSGENIYPEEIENELKANPLVSECLVLNDDIGLVARVFLDQEKLKLQFEELKHNVNNFPIWKENTLEDIRKTMNKRLSNFSKISHIVEQEIPFKLTPSLKVKRFLYM